MFCYMPGQTAIETEIKKFPDPLEAQKKHA